MHLSMEFSRVRFASLYMGWGEFLHELNQFINHKVRHVDDGLDFVTLDHTHGEPSRGQARLHVFLEKSDFDHDSGRLLAAVKYFLGEKGLTIVSTEKDPFDPSSSSLVLNVSGLSRYDAPEHYPNIKNSWMRQSLLSGTVIDVREVGVEVEPGVFHLTGFTPGVDYVDSVEEEFIQSIKRDRQSGEILAATDNRFFAPPDDPDDETLFLR